MKNAKDWDRELAEAGLPPVVPWKQVATLTGVSLKSLARWRDEGRLRVLRTAMQGSGRVLVERTEVARLLAALSNGKRA